MNELKERILFNLIRAWRRLFVFTPAKWSLAASKGAAENILVFAAFPVIGFAVAWLAIWAFAILGVLITQAAAAVFFGLFMTGLMLWKDHGKALTVFCSVSGSLAAGTKLATALDDQDGASQDVSGLGTVVITLVAAAEFFVFWSCFRNGTSGLVAIFVIIYFTSQGYFSTKGGLKVSSEELGGVCVLTLLLLLVSLVAAPFIPALFMLLAATAVMALVAGLSKLLPMDEVMWQYVSGVMQLLLLLVMFVAVLS